MKLFFWNDPYPVTFGGSMLIAVAETEEQALDEIQMRARHMAYGVDTPTLIGYPADLVAKLGKPSRVVNLPCAEFHEWSE